jgi:hypothetical protein
MSYSLYSNSEAAGRLKIRTLKTGLDRVVPLQVAAGPTADGSCASDRGGLGGPDPAEDSMTRRFSTFGAAAKSSPPLFCLDS